MDMTHPSSGHEQPEGPIKIQHPEEEDHHESGASKMFNKVKARAKKLKNNLGKHGNEPNQDVDKEEDDEQLQQVHNHPKASESSAVSGCVTDHQFDQKTESGINKNSPTGFTGESGEGFPAKSHELGLNTEYGIGKDSPRETEDVKVPIGLGRDLPTGTHDQFSPELSRPKERDDSDFKHEEAKPSTYMEKIASATSVITDKAIAAKNAVASKLGYPGETTGVGGGNLQHKSTVGEETSPGSATGYGQKMAGTVAGTLSPVYEKVKKSGSNVMTKLPLSGGGRGTETTQQREDKGVSARDYLAEKLRPGEEDKALSEVIAEKLYLGGGQKKTTMTKEVEKTVEKIPSDQVLQKSEHGEVIGEEGKGQGGGMVGKLKGAVTSWLGGTKEKEAKPKSSDSSEEASQSLGSTVGTRGFVDSGGVVPTHRELQESVN